MSTYTGATGTTGTTGPTTATVVDDDADPVVREIDVFVTNKISRMLCMMQFPLRPPWRTLESQQIAQVRLKPLKAGPRIEMDLALPRGPTYDAEATYPISQQTLRSATVPLQTNYALGILREGRRGALGDAAANDQLHLTPVHLAMQMRPSFAYIDDAQRALELAQAGGGDDDDDANNKANGAKGAGGAADVKKEGNEGESEDVEVQVQFKRRETQPKSMTARRHLAAAAAAKEESETAFVPLQLLDVDSPAHAAIFEQLVCKAAVQREPIPWNVTRQDYLELLAPTPTLEAYVVAQKRELLRGAVSMEALRAMPDADAQVRAMMCAAGTLPYAKIRALATAAHSEEELLLKLREHCVLVHGRWVVRSALVAAAGMIAVRDYVLLLLAEADHVAVRDVARATGVPGDRIKTVLQRFAVCDGSAGWRFKQPCDTAFVAQHPDVVAHFERDLAEQRPATLRAVQQVKNRLVPLDAPAGPATSPALPGLRGTSVSPRPGTGGAPGGGPGAAGTGMPGTLPAAAQGAPDLGKYQKPLTDFLTELFRMYGSCNMTFLRGQLSRRVCDDDDGNSLFGAKISDSVFNAVLRQVALTMHDTWFLKQRGDPEVDRVREVVIRVFRDRTTVRKSDMKQECQKAFGTDKLPIRAMKVALEELAYSKSNAWIFKPGNGNNA